MAPIKSDKSNNIKIKKIKKFSQRNKNYVINSLIKKDNDFYRKLTPKTYFKDYVYDDITILCKKKNKLKVKADEFEIPQYEDFHDLVKLNFNLQQLKTISRHYSQKVSGNKKQLIFNLYNFLKYSYYSKKIQYFYRGFAIRKMMKLHGPAVFNRKCTNEHDFLTFEPIKNIPYYQFYSYKDIDGFIYGFDICSIYNMLKDDEYTKNPYNRNDLPSNTLENIVNIIKISKKFNYPLKINIDDEIKQLSKKKQIELKAVKIFQKIDSMGFITNSKWLIGLNRHLAKRYLRELDDVWNYRAQLSQNTKNEILPPNGKLFSKIYLLNVLQKPLIEIHDFILNTIEKLITIGVNAEARSLGCFYALGTFTIVSQDAASSLPWLYESFLINQS